MLLTLVVGEGRSRGGVDASVPPLPPQHPPPLLPPPPLERRPLSAVEERLEGGVLIALRGVLCGVSNGVVGFAVVVPDGAVDGPAVP